MSNRWSRIQNVGDCKTCLCRISPQKSTTSSTTTETNSEDETSEPPPELCDSQMSTQLLNSLNGMRQDESLCDVILCVDNASKKFPAHKVILAAASPYFRKMFSCGFKEAKNGEVTFHDIQPEVLQAVINFIYTGKVQIDETIVDGLLDAGDLLQLPSLRNLCLWWLTMNLNPVNCLGIYVLASLRLHLDLAETAKQYALDHFREVSEGEEFLHISPDCLLAVFLESPYLACDNDGQLLKALIEWTNYNEEKRKSYLLSFLQKIHLDEVLPQVLIEVIQYPAVSSIPSVEKLIRDALTAVLSKKFDAIEPKPVEEGGGSNGLEEELTVSSYASPKVPMRCFYQQDVIFAIGGESQGQSLSNVECFMMGYDGWKCSIPRPFSQEMVIIPTMKQCRFYPAVASDKYSVYVIGGQDCGFPLNIVEKYDVLENRWETLSRVPISVHGSGAAIVNSRLYLVGGRNSQKPEKRVWLYDNKSDAWIDGLPMNTYRAHLSVCSSIGELYAIGGIGGTKESESSYLNSVEKFDPITNTWTTLSPMHEERAFHSAAVVDCHIFALGGCDGKLWLRTVERFDIMSGQWSKVANMSVPRSSFGTSVQAGRIYCVGGYDGYHFLNTVEKYNPRTDRWHCVHAMQIERYGLVVATLAVPLKSHVTTTNFS